MMSRNSAASLARATELASTERGVPGTLCLVEHDDMLVRWLRAIEVVAQESHQWLNGALGLLPRHAQAAALFMRIAGERLAHDMDQRQIAGQERGTASSRGTPRSSRTVSCRRPVCR